MTVSRRGMMAATAAAGVAAAMPLGAHATLGGGAVFALVPRPTRVFKTADRSHENTESWIFSLAVQTASAAPLTPAAMRIELLKGAQVVRTAAYPAAGLAPLTYRSGLPPTLADGSAPPVPVFWPFLIRLRHTEPVGLGVDGMRIAVDAADAAGRRHSSTRVVPIETYQQKTALIFPFRGKAIVLQGGASNGGHRNRSGAFALDAMGLDDAWSVEAPGDGKKNTDYPGFGRTLIAPAAGTIVRATADRPDQPVGDESNPDFFAPQYKKLGGGDPGNHVVIDHGNGEFSMIAHFQAGSLMAKVGDAVAQGQVLGKLGHSGDTNAPHVHYQLQAGPDIVNSDGLPCRFGNVDQAILDRGTYFEAT